MASIRTESRVETGATAVSLVVALAAAVVLVAANTLKLHTDADEIVVLGFILGWMLVVAAVAIAGVVAVHLVRAPRRPTTAEILLLVLTAAVLSATIWLNPLYGSGSAAA